MAWYHFIPGVGVAILAGETITKAVNANQTNTKPLVSTDTNVEPIGIKDTPKTEVKDEGEKDDRGKDEKKGVNFTTTMLLLLGGVSALALIIVFVPRNKSKMVYNR